ncbi:MAG: hypothetical protein FJ102_06300 [Deltaproteobacteria bacterium]|nr:hypothetical protein [Deltaproteobacteria bacterium]
MSHDLSARVRSDAAVAIRAAGEMQFGVVRALEGDRAVVELAHPLDLGAASELKVELGPVLGHALCVATAGRTLLTADEEAKRQLFRVVEVAEGDADRWLRWRQALIDGGTFTDLSGLTTSSVSGNEPNRRGALRDVLAAAAQAVRPGVAPAEISVEIPGPRKRD